MPVQVTETELPGVLLIEAPIFRDERGFFMETFSEATWPEAGLDETFVQDNMSLSSKGTLRGLHFQKAPHGMGKLIRAATGSVYDVAVDLRRGSPTFGQWTGHTLSQDNGLAMWVPPGFAHGFLSLEDESLVYYKCTALYAPESERSVNYADPAIGVEWPFPPTLVSQKDIDAPNLDRADFNFTFSA